MPRPLSLTTLYKQKYLSHLCYKCVLIMYIIANDLSLTFFYKILSLITITEKMNIIYLNKLNIFISPLSDPQSKSPLDRRFKVLILTKTIELNEPKWL